MRVCERKTERLFAFLMFRVKKERGFLWHLMKLFLLVLEKIPREGELKMLLVSSVTNCVLSGEVNEDAVSYCERVLEFLTDLLAQLPTRRFFNTLLDSSHLIVKQHPML